MHLQHRHQLRHQNAQCCSRSYDLASGERQLVWENTQEFLSIGFDWNYTPRYAAKSVTGGGVQLLRIEGDDEITPWMEVDYEDNLGTHPIVFDKSNNRLLFYTSVGRETSALLWHDLASGAETTVLEYPKYDVSNVIFDPESYDVDAASIAGPRDEWAYIAPHHRDDLALLQDRFANFEVDVTSQTDDNRQWVVVTLPLWISFGEARHCLVSDYQSIRSMSVKSIELPSSRVIVPSASSEKRI